MKQFVLMFFTYLVSVSAISQNTHLGEYRYVVVPEKFEFLNAPDQYELNSMTLFYLDKSGFNAYLSNEVPNTNRCDGLYADVEDLKSLLQTRLQVVLRDCNENEVYRSEVGKSKYKDYNKSYQDALRKAFRSIENLGVTQKELVPLSDSKNAGSVEVISNISEIVSVPESQVSMSSGILLPTSKFSNYSIDGNSFLLRKTSDGYSLYQEKSSTEDGLQLMGKIVVMEELVKYLDVSGKVFDAVFDIAGNLTIKDVDSSVVYHLMN